MNSRKIWTLVVLAVLSTFAIFASFRRQSPPPRIRDLSGGVTVQRQRIDRAIETAGALSLEEAIASLGQYNESYELAGLASMTSSSFGYCKMNSMLADRRISRIFEHLQSLSANEASEKSQQIFGDQFAIFTKEWLDFVKTGGRPRTGPPHHAASAALLYCSFFCSSETLDAKIRLWNDTITTPEFEQMVGIQIHNPSRLIDRLFLLNLLVISGHKQQKSTSQLNKELELLCAKISGDANPFLQVTQMRMFKWNAETLDTDFTHRTRGIPASGNAVLLELPGFADPDAWLSLENPEVVAQFLDCIRRWRDR